jgi:hypothetical protein
MLDLLAVYNDTEDQQQPNVSHSMVFSSSVLNKKSVYKKAAAALLWLSCKKNINVPIILIFQKI